MIKGQASVVVYADKIHHRIYRTLHETISLLTFDETLSHVEERSTDIVLIDCGIDINRGLDIVKKVKLLHSGTITILITETSSEELAIEAFRLGVREYFKKPVDLALLQSVVNKLLEIKNPARKNRTPYISPGIDTRESVLDIKGRVLPANLLCALRFMRAHITKNTRLLEYAQSANLSKFHFCRQFKRCIGMSPVEYMRLLRINSAKELLSKSQLGILEIGYAVGFNHYSGFSRNFKKYTGMTPSQYRSANLHKSKLPK